MNCHFDDYRIWHLLVLHFAVFNIHLFCSGIAQFKTVSVEAFYDTMLPWDILCFTCWKCTLCCSFCFIAHVCLWFCYRKCKTDTHFKKLAFFITGCVFQFLCHFFGFLVSQSFRLSNLFRELFTLAVFLILVLFHDLFCHLALNTVSGVT